MSARVVVVGGGAAGLAAAYRVRVADPSLDVVVLEAADAVGGRLRTAAVGDLELEAGPDSFVARKPWAVDLCRELGLDLSAPGASGAFVWTDHGLEAMPPTALGVPADLDALARWPGLSGGARLRALADVVRRPRSRPNETLGGLLRRRLGDEATEALVAPLLGGLFAGDVDRLGVTETFPELATWERTYGGLLRGARAALRSASAAGPMFLRPAGGVRALPKALADAIGVERVRTGIGAASVETEVNGFAVVGADGSRHPADAVVLAAPAFASAKLLGPLAPVAARALDAIRYVSTAVVLLRYVEGTADALPDATGFVVPTGRAPMTATTFLSRKWPDPRFTTRAVVRCFVGADGSEDVLDAPDEDIVGAVGRHLAAVLPLPERAEASAVVRWPRSMPQYEVGHLERVEAVERALPPGIVLAGNAYHGIGVADAVRSANEAAERVLAHVAGHPAAADTTTERVP
jgi:oxygen-dependent protoporphyrinogen oxidase